MAYNQSEVIRVSVDILVSDQYEGFAPNAKPDPPAGWKGINQTPQPDKAYKQYGVGFGHVITQAEYTQGYIDLGGNRRVTVSGIRGATTTITREQALILITKELPSRFLNPVKSILGQALLNKLSTNQIAACVSYAYNAGPGSASNPSNGGFAQLFFQKGLKEALEAGNYTRAGEIFRDFGARTAQGSSDVRPELVARRKREGDIIAGVTLPPSDNAVIPPLNVDKYFDETYIKPLRAQGATDEFINALINKQIKYENVVLQDKVSREALTDTSQLQPEIDFIRAITGAGAVFQATARSLVTRTDTFLPSEASYLIQNNLFEFEPDLMRQQMIANAGDPNNPGINENYSHAWRAPGKLAITANITIPGASGFKIGQIFWVGRTYEHYKKHGAFQLFGLTETIDMSRGWTTELYARFNAMPTVKAQLLKGV